MMMRGCGKVWSSMLLLKGERKRERGRINRAALWYKLIEWKVMERRTGGGRGGVQEEE